MYVLRLVVFLKAWGNQKLLNLLVGRVCEYLARFIMMLRGYRCVDSRLNKYNAECDLIMRRGKNLVLVEVKYRSQCNDALTSWRSKQRSRFLRFTRAYHSKYADMDLSVVFATFWSFGYRFCSLDWYDLKYTSF